MFIDTRCSSSFFDDSDLRFGFGFTKLKMKNRKDLQTTPVHAGSLTYTDPTTGEIKTGLYGLYNQQLVSYTIVSFCICLN